MNLLESRWLANSLMGLYPELSPGGGAMPGINPWGNMRGNTVHGLFRPFPFNIRVKEVDYLSSSMINLIE